MTEAASTLLSDVFGSFVRTATGLGTRPIENPETLQMQLEMAPRHLAAFAGESAPGAAIDVTAMVVLGLAFGRIKAAAATARRARLLSETERSRGDERDAFIARYGGGWTA